MKSHFKCIQRSAWCHHLKLFKEKRIVSFNYHTICLRECSKKKAVSLLFVSDPFPCPSWCEVISSCYFCDVKNLLCWGQLERRRLSVCRALFPYPRVRRDWGTRRTQPHPFSNSSWDLQVEVVNLEQWFYRIRETSLNFLHKYYIETDLRRMIAPVGLVVEMLLLFVLPDILAGEPRYTANTPVLLCGPYLWSYRAC